MRRSLISASVLALTGAATLGAMSATSAVGGTGAYANWTESGTTAAASFSGTYFPGLSATRTGGSWQVPTGATAWLSSQTPFGAQYGSSQNLGYLGVSLPLGGTTTETTITFDTVPTAGDWGFALGDIDAENLTITATDSTGAALNVSGWFQSAFNYCNVSPKPSSCPSGTHSDQPTWNSPVITGSATDTYGAAAWFKPTSGVKTLTFSQARNVSGAPAYQLWIAADIQASPSPSPSSSASASASASPSASASASATASASASPSAATCSTNVTNLVNGSFEEPAIPAKSYRQLKDAAVPGWNTTASDRLIEIWSDGFQGVTSPAGSQFAEINATMPAELYQDVVTVPGEELTWSLYHRARGSKPVGDTMSVNIGAPGDAANSTTAFTDALSDGWVLHTGTYVVPAGQVLTRFGFESGPTASGSKSIGNFLDNIYFTRTECLPAGATVEPESIADPSPTPTATASETATTTELNPPVVITPEEAPKPDDTIRPTKDDPLVVDPNGPTPIDVIKESGADPDSTITAVEEPDHGNVVVEDDVVIYTPEDGYRGDDTIVAYVTEPNDRVLKVVTNIETGRDQVPTAPLGLPAMVKPAGQTVLIDHPVRTNAGLRARVKATCIDIQRSKPQGDVVPCRILRSGSVVSVVMAGQVPMGVRVTVSAPSNGKYGPYLKVRDYLVRPKG